MSPTSSSDGSSPRSAGAGWQHESRPEFVRYYARSSQAEATLRRYRSIRELMLRELGRRGRAGVALDVADVGCGAATQCLLWAELGHRVHGIDVNAELIEIGRERARETGREVELRVGSATRLPWSTESMDVCLIPELLEHVSDWEACLDEGVRVLRPGGLLFLSTTNKLCPRQHEFSLPLYSWYPTRLKRHYERLARTSRPELANYATYPAVNWFTFFGLRRALARRGARAADRFDVMDLGAKGPLARAVVRAIRALPALRRLGHVLSESTLLVAEKSREAGPT